MTITQTNALLLKAELKNPQIWDPYLTIQSENDGSLTMLQGANSEINEDADIQWPAGEELPQNGMESGIIYNNFEFQTYLN